LRGQARKQIANRLLLLPRRVCGGSRAFESSTQSGACQPSGRFHCAFCNQHSNIVGIRVRTGSQVDPGVLDERAIDWAQEETRIRVAVIAPSPESGSA
jgi:hypothetical protein